MESDVLRELYEKYHQKAYLYVLSLCRDKETAEDIVSEGFEKAFLTVEGCPEGFFWWLLRVCRNLWLDTLRKQKRQGGEIPEEIPVCQLSSGYQRRTRDSALVLLCKPRTGDFLLWRSG